MSTALRLTTLDPLQEAVHRTPMRLYARQGGGARHSSNTRSASECCGESWERSPKPRLKRLYQELLRRPAEAMKGPTSRDSPARPAQKRAPVRLDLPVAEPGPRLLLFANRVH